MAKETRSDSGHADDKERAASESKAAAKKATKKKKKSKAKAKKKSVAKKAKTAKTSAPVDAAPQTPAAPPPAAPAASVPPPHESAPSGPMRGIVALWGPLAIIVLLIVIARIGDESSVDMPGSESASLPASLETAEGIAGDVVEHVRDALTGGDPRTAAALGAGAGTGRSSGDDLAAAFQDSGATGAPPAPKSSQAPDPWDASSQTTVPAGMAASPGALPPPYPENPWAPVDPLAPGMPADPYSQGYSQGYYQGAPPPPGRGYGSHAGGYGPGGMYGDPGQHYPMHRGGYGPPQGYGERGPGYGERGPGYGRRHPYAGGPGYGQPPAYGEPQGYPYSQPYYGEPAPYPRDYYPPAQ